jgi:hemerythrin
MENTSVIPDLVVWDEKYDTGIKLIDDQHKELCSLTNELFRACLNENESIEEVFKDTMRRMFDYVHFHFGAEQELMQRIKYPGYQEHKQQHDTFVRDVIASVKEYNEGKSLVPNHFVRSLRDWILSHIALSDKLYASFIANKKKLGYLSDKDING